MLLRPKICPPDLISIFNILPFRMSGNSPLCPTGHRPFGAAALLSLHYITLSLQAGHRVPLTMCDLWMTCLEHFRCEEGSKGGNARFHTFQLDHPGPTDQCLAGLGSRGPDMPGNHLVPNSRDLMHIPDLCLLLLLFIFHLLLLLFLLLFLMMMMEIVFFNFFLTFMVNIL